MTMPAAEPPPPNNNPVDRCLPLVGYRIWDFAGCVYAYQPHALGEASS